MGKNVSELDYGEVVEHLHILEHEAYQRGLSEYQLEYQQELRAREKTLLYEKHAQPFRDGSNEQDRLAWGEAGHHSEFDEVSDGLCRRHLNDDIRLTAKQNQDITKFGRSRELDDLHQREAELHARQFDEERGRYAREFLESREIAQELEHREKATAPEQTISNDNSPKAERSLDAEALGPLVLDEDFERIGDALVHPEFAATVILLHQRRKCEFDSLELKQQDEVRRLGASEGLTKRHEQEVYEHQKNFNDDLIRYAREFFASQRLSQRLEREDTLNRHEGDLEPEH